MVLSAWNRRSSSACARLSASAKPTFGHTQQGHNQSEDTVSPLSTPRHKPRHYTLDTGHWTLDTGHWTLDTRHWTLDTRHLTLDTGH
eukprot:4734703-Pyramimonas_sp.AAC.1